MERIDKYVDTIYRDFDKTDKETKILIEETKSHLYDEIEDLKMQGFSDEESIEKAILNFGKENSVTSEMNYILKKQNKFSKVLIIIAIVIFSIGVVFKLINLGYDLSGIESRKMQPYENDRFYSYSVFDEIKEKLSNKDYIDETTKDDITKILDEFNMKTNNGLYYIDIRNNSECCYEYRKDIDKDRISDGGGSTGNQYWNIDYKKTDLQEKYDSLINEKIFSYTITIPYQLNESASYLFVLSWILVCISSFNNAYMKNMISKEYIAFFTVSSLIILSMFASGKHTLRELMVLVLALLFLGSEFYNKNYFNRKSTIESISC